MNFFISGMLQVWIIYSIYVRFINKTRTRRIALKTEKALGHAELKRAFEVELKRLGHIPPSEENTDFLSLVLKLGDMHVIAQTIAYNEVRHAYNILTEIKKQTEDTDNNFLYNVLIILVGIPTPPPLLIKQQGFEQEYTAAA